MSFWFAYNEAMNRAHYLMCVLASRVLHIAQNYDCYTLIMHISRIVRQMVYVLHW